MTLSTCIKEYVRHRRSLGVQFHGEQVQLSAFVRSVGDIEVSAIDAKAVHGYLDGKGPVTHAWFSRYHTVAGLYRFAIARQYVTHAPLPPRSPKPPGTLQREGDAALLVHDVRSDDGGGPAILEVRHSGRAR